MIIRVFEISSRYRLLNINTHYIPVILGAFAIQYRVYTENMVCTLYLRHRKTEYGRIECGKMANTMYNNEKTRKR